MFQLFLPYPPSVNNYWGFSQSRRFLTAKARAFKDEVHYKVIQSKYPKFSRSYIKVSVELYPPDRRKRDIDNPLKPLFDSLVAANLFDDDSQIQELVVVRKEVIKGGSCRVTIEKI
jgi:crossover junction endodeoxyribonuclease RusA